MIWTRTQIESGKFAHPKDVIHGSWNRAPSHGRFAFRDNFVQDVLNEIIEGFRLNIKVNYALLADNTTDSIFWCTDTLDKFWFMTEHVFFFENKEDITMFVLRFGQSKYVRHIEESMK